MSRRYLAAAVAAAALAAPVAAQSWTGAASSDWGTGTNWSGGAVPASGAALTFPAVANQAVALDANRTAGGLTFSSANPYSVSGFTLTLTGITQNGAGTITFASAVNIGNGNR
ncbi:MAG: hypothetical protein ABGY75_14065, partial [Gemmataceae bacterium]